MSVFILTISVLSIIALAWWAFVKLLERMDRLIDAQRRANRKNLVYFLVGAVVSAIISQLVQAAINHVDASSWFDSLRWPWS